MTFTDKISPELKDILLACTTKKQRDEVAERFGVSKHTLVAIMLGERYVNDNNQQCIIELLRLAMANAKKMDKTLMDYFLDLATK